MFKPFVHLSRQLIGGNAFFLNKKSRFLLREAGSVNIVILGAGFAGLCSSIYLHQFLGKYKNIHITVIDKNSHHLFLPFLHEVATGSVPPDHIKRPIRALLAGKDINFIRGEVQGIDLKENFVENCSRCQECNRVDRCLRRELAFPEDKIVPRISKIAFDYLVISLGSSPNFFNIPGADKHSFVADNLKSAETIKEHIWECFEIADHVDDEKIKKELLTFVVVGGGATGVELAAEIHDLFHQVLSKEFSFANFNKYGKIILIEARNTILPDIDSDLRTYALAKLEKKEVDILTNSPVLEVTAGGIKLSGANHLPSRTVIWAAGVKANTFVEHLPFKKDSSSRVEVDAHLNVINHPRIFAIGDNAYSRAENINDPLPPTAQVAVQQALYAARNITHKIVEKDLIPFYYFHFGSSLSLGEKSGIAKFTGFLSLRGFAAWFSWKSLYLKHLMVIERLPEALWDWFTDLVFNRRLARFKVH